MHDSLVQVIYNSKLLELWGILYHVLFDLLHLIFRVVEDSNGILISIIIKVDEPVVEEESAVALLAIAIIYLLTSLYIIESINNKATSIISVVPGCLSWALMVEHVGIGNKTVCFNSFNLDAKNTTWDHHTNLWVFLQRKLSKFWHFFANKVVICLYVHNLLLYLVKEGTALEPFLFFIGKEYWEVCIRFRQNINVDVPLRIRLPSLLHYIGTKEWMLGRYKSLS